MVGIGTILKFGAPLALAIGIYFYGLHSGKIAERVVWQGKEQTRLNALSRQLQEMTDEKLRIEKANAELSAQVERKKLENNELTDEVRMLIDREPTVRLVPQEVPANCPAVSCVVPDIAHDVRMHNCAIEPAGCDTNAAARQARFRDVAMLAGEETALLLIDP